MLLKERKIDLNGHELLLRSPREEDARMLINTLRILCGETQWLLRRPEEVTMTAEQEIGWIRSHNDGEDSLVILGFLDGEYAGNCEFSGKDLKNIRHHVSIGIGILQKYCGMGIGTAFLRTLIREAAARGYEMMELRAMASNKRALHLYEKMGFREIGRAPRYFRYADGSCDDDVWMMLDLTAVKAPGEVSEGSRPGGLRQESGPEA